MIFHIINFLMSVVLSFQKLIVNVVHQVVEQQRAKLTNNLKKFYMREITLPVL